MRSQKAETGKSKDAGNLTGTNLSPVTSSTPLISPEQEQGWNQRLDTLNRKWRSDKRKLSWQDYDRQRNAVENERMTAIVEAVKQRSVEYVDALLLLVGSRGAKPLDFYKAFSLSADPAVREDIATHDTPENRRLLHSLLGALAEMPADWNEIDYRRFLTGTGEPKKAKYDYPGKSMLKKGSGWTGVQIDFVCKQLAGDESLYAKVLRLHEAPQEAVAEEAEEPEVEVDVEIDPENYFDVEDSRSVSSYEPEPKPEIQRNKEFIASLRRMLEERGLAEAPSKPAKKSAKVKEFKVGDAIKKADLKKLPLPAHIRVNLDRRVSPEDPWCKEPLEQVITALNEDGSYSYLWATFSLEKHGELVGHADPENPTLPQELVHGAMYLGPWEGSEELGLPDEFWFEVKQD